MVMAGQNVAQNAVSGPVVMAVVMVVRLSGLHVDYLRRRRMMVSFHVVMPRGRMSMLIVVCIVVDENRLRLVMRVVVSVMMMAHFEFKVYTNNNFY